MDEVLQLQPHIAEWQEKYNFHLVIVSSDSSRDLKSFLTENHIEATVLLDPRLEVAKQYEIQAIPTSFFFDENGESIKRSLGWAGKKNLQEVEDWLKE